MREAEPEEFAKYEEFLTMLTPAERQAALSLAFYQGMKMVMRKLNREQVTFEEADRWAKVTEIVYRKFFENLQAGPVIWGFITVGIIAGKKPLAPVDTNKTI